MALSAADVKSALGTKEAGLGNTQVPIQPFTDAINEIVGKPSVIEIGFLNNLKHKGLDAISPMSGNSNVWWAGDGGILRYRKVPILPGGTRDANLTDNTIFNISSNVEEININKTFSFRAYIDPAPMAQIAKTYSGEGNINEAFGQSGMPDTLKEALVAFFISNISITTQLKLISVLVEDIYAAAVKANSIITIDIDSIINSATTNQLEIATKATMQIAFALAEKSTLLSKYMIGNNLEDYTAIVDARIPPVIDLFYKSYWDREQKFSENRNVTTLKGIPMFTNPLMDKLANKKADRTKPLSDATNANTLYDMDTTYDFTGLLGLIYHKQSFMMGMSVSYFQINKAPSLPGFFLVFEMVYGSSTPRPELIIAIKKGTSGKQATLLSRKEQKLLDKIRAREIAGNIAPIGTSAPIAR